MSFPMFQEDLDYIATVTEALNNLPAHSKGNYYIHVELHHEGSHEKAGAWCDEIATDAWYFEATQEDA